MSQVTFRKNVFIFVALLLLLFAAFAVSVFFGGAMLGIPDVLRALLAPSSVSENVRSIIWHIRIPRVLLGMLAGAGLAASGTVFQGVLRNPLADPYTLGVSAGAALGITLGTVTGLADLAVFSLPLCAFTGALLSVALVYGLASRRGFSLHTLILGGVVLGFVLSSVVLFIMAFARADQVHAALLWLMGDLSSADTDLLALTAAIVAAGTALLALGGRSIDVLTLGDEKASHLGVESGGTRRNLFVTASLITGACVAVSGVIGFVGLMVPHLMRRIMPSGHRTLIPAAALGGAIFLPLCDTLARTLVAPVELPVGVITGCIGGIFFLMVLSKAGRYDI